MKANAILFWLLAAFFGLCFVTYVIWTYLNSGMVGVEVVGSFGLGLSALLAVLIAFYLNRVHAAQGGELPQDRLDANIDDDDPELGFFSPWSWWPIVLAGSAALLFFGLAVGFWLAYIAVAVGIIALVGWVYEYYRGLFAR